MKDGRFYFLGFHVCLFSSIWKASKDWMVSMMKMTFPTTREDKERKKAMETGNSVEVAPMRWRKKMNKMSKDAKSVQHVENMMEYLRR